MPSRERVTGTLQGLAGSDSHVWVAGSAAIIPEMADDIDVWILKGSSLKLKSFNMNFWTVMPDLAEYQAIPKMVARLEVIVPEILSEPPLKVQVMFTGMNDIKELLSYFDMSCHCYARNTSGGLYIDPFATLPGSPIECRYEMEPYENGCACPACSGNQFRLDRLKKFQTRYADAEATRKLLWLPS